MLICYYNNMKRSIFISLTIVIIVGYTQFNMGLAQNENDGWKEYALTKPAKAAPLKILTPEQLLDGKKHNKPPESYENYLTGNISDGTTLKLVDVDKNKQYDDVGKDVMVIGNATYGVPFSKTINIKNKLYSVKVDVGDLKISLKQYEGATGKVDLVSKYKCNIQLEMAIITSGNGDFFDVAKNKSFFVPCGTYSLYMGYLTEGKVMHMAIKGDKMERIEVKKAEGNNNDATVVSWGGPLKFDFNVNIGKKTEPVSKDKKATGKPQEKNKTVAELTIPYHGIKVVGSANEEYLNFSTKLMPEVEVKDTKGEDALVGARNFCPS
jgi:hypothetical protein